MMAGSHIEDLSIRELMAFIFLIEEAKPADELEKLALSDPEFRVCWQKAEVEFKELIEHYPNEDEERHLLSAHLEAVCGIYPFSEEALNLKNQFRPIIEILLKR